MNQTSAREDGTPRRAWRHGRRLRMRLHQSLHRVLLLLLAPLAATALSHTANAEIRIALVIGVADYIAAPPLTTPVNDARDIGDALKRLDFEVEELRNPDFRTLSRGLRDFGLRAQQADTAVIYYAGHGAQVDGENYLIPADAKLERAHDLNYEALPFTLMLGEVAGAKHIGIVFLDSCRNNPFADRVARSFTSRSRAAHAPQGLARVDNVPRNTLIMMAAKAGQIADDGVAHSPFAAAILAHLKVPGLELGMFVRSVRDVVLKATQNRQEPFVASSLGADPFFFFPRNPNRPPELGTISPLQVQDTAGPTPLGIPTPTDPDLDPLLVRIVTLPRGGEVRVAGKPAAAGNTFSAEQLMSGTFKPDGSVVGDAGTFDFLVEDGRGGSVLGKLPIIVVASRIAAPPVAPPQAQPLPPPAPALPQVQQAPPPAAPTQAAAIRPLPVPQVPATQPQPAPPPATQALAAPPQAAIPPAPVSPAAASLPRPATPGARVVQPAVSRPPAATTPPPRKPEQAGNPRCQEIVRQVSMGEPLSDSDRSFLRSNCGR